MTYSTFYYSAAIYIILSDHKSIIEVNMNMQAVCERTASKIM